MNKIPPAFAAQPLKKKITPGEGVVGFYESDPGGPKSPNTVYGVTGGKVSVLEPSGLVFEIAKAEWMSIDEMESSTLAVLASEEHDLKEMMLRGRIAALVDAHRLMAARFSAVVDYAASLDQRELAPTGDDFNALYNILLDHPGRASEGTIIKRPRDAFSKTAEGEYFPGAHVKEVGSVRMGDIVGEYFVPDTVP